MLAAAKLMGDVLEVGPGDRIYGTSKLFFAFSLHIASSGPRIKGLDDS